MKKHLYGIIFTAAVFAAAAGIYFLVLNSQADYPAKLIFSGLLLLLALIVGIFASSKTKDAKSRAVARAINGAKFCGIGIYSDGEFVFANSVYSEAEQNANVSFYKALKDGKTPDGYTVTAETHEDGKDKYTVIFVTENRSAPLPEAPADGEVKTETEIEEENE
ncbi:MAG: hypothetical protein J5816_01115 [Clostridia bacterium]|nr:hypothetical protein [Clostridia bacterium]